MISFNYKSGIISALVAVSAIAVILAIRYSPVSDCNFETDEAVHFLTAIDYSEFLKSAGPYQLPSIMHVERKYPPLVTLLTGLIFTFTGISCRTGILVISIFIPLLLFSIYGTARNTGWNRLPALAAATSVLLVPQIVRMSRLYMLDFPMTALVIFATWCISGSRNFQSTQMAVLSGIATGLALLAKWTAFIFLLPVFFWFGIQSLKTKKSTINIIIAALTALLLAGTWYFPNLPTIFDKFMTDGLSRTGPSTTGQLFPSVLSPQSWLINVSLLHRMLPGSLIGLFFLSFSGLFFSKIRNKTVIFPFFWLFASFMIVCLLPPREPRFLVPLLPVAVLASTVSLSFEWGKSKFMKEVIPVLIIIAGILLFGKAELFTPPAITFHEISSTTMIAEKPSNSYLK